MVGNTIQVIGAEEVIDAGREGRGEEAGRGQAIAPTMLRRNRPGHIVHSLSITQKV